MIEYILDYLANRGVYAASQGEQQQMEDGIARYLQENGLEDGNTGAYYQKYVSNHLQEDLCLGPESVLFKLRSDQRREPDCYRV